eukprot:4720454-Pyramimonas_sp.AAC.1
MGLGHVVNGLAHRGLRGLHRLAPPGRSTDLPLRHNQQQSHTMTYPTQRLLASRTHHLPSPITPARVSSARTRRVH